MEATALKEALAEVTLENRLTSDTFLLPRMISTPSAHALRGPSSHSSLRSSLYHAQDFTGSIHISARSYIHKDN